jgi:transglutaminase-like putative cysteine protease
MRPGPAAPAVIVAVLAVMSALGFRGVFPDWSFLPAAVIGALGAATVSFLCRAFGLPAAESVVVSLVAFAALGAFAAEGVPTPDAYQTFGSGLINGWARLLSSVPPAALVAEYRVLPYTVGWLAALVGSELLRADRAAGWPVIGPVAGLGLTTLISVEHRRVALLQGAALVVGALVLGFLQELRRNAADEFDASEIGGSDLGAGDPIATPPVWHERAAVRAGAALALAAAIGALAGVVGPRVPNADANERFDLRRFQTPPFDPLNEPTPLGQVKTGLQEANADKVVLRATAPEAIDRVTLAVLDNYTGEFWQVADEAPGAPAEFRPVDTIFPVPGDGTLDGWQRIEATIEIDQLDQLAGGEFDPVWLPVPGWPVSVSSDDQLDVRFNADTGTLALAPDGPHEGLTYDVVAALPPPVEQTNLAGAAVTLREPYDLAVPQLRAFAGDVLEGADVGWEQVEAIRRQLVDTGAYDSRADSRTALPGHHLGRLAEFVNDPERIVGFEEQYAATAALIARSEGLPARVVVGFRVSDDELAERTLTNGTERTVTFLADDINAWIEVRFDGVGWLPFDVTPPRDRAPEDAPVGRTEREVAVPNPPPDPPPPALPPDLDLDNELDEEVEEDDDEEQTGGGFPVRTVLIGAAASTPLLLLIGGMLAVVFLKRRRTARRRHAPTPSRQVAGAWYELMDRLAEQGAAPPRAATRREVAAGLHEAAVVSDDEAVELVALADDVDRAAFHPEPPDPGLAERAWQHTDVVASAVLARRPKWRRAVQRIDPRPLLHRDPLAVDEPEPASESELVRVSAEAPE